MLLQYAMCSFYIQSYDSFLRNSITNSLTKPITDLKSSMCTLVLASFYKRNSIYLAPKNCWLEIYATAMRL